MMVGIKDQKDPRDRLHHGGWMAKIVCWFVLVILMFFIPNGVVSFYGEILSSVFTFMELCWLETYEGGNLVKDDD